MSHLILVMPTFLFGEEVVLRVSYGYSQCHVCHASNRLSYLQCPIDRYRSIIMIHDELFFYISAHLPDSPHLKKSPCAWDKLAAWPSDASIPTPHCRCVPRAPAAAEWLSLWPIMFDYHKVGPPNDN